MRDMVETETVARITRVYISENYFFFIYKEPNLFLDIPQNKKNRRLGEDPKNGENNSMKNRSESSVGTPSRRSSHVETTSNLFDYLIRRGKALNLHDIKVLLLDLLKTLQLLHSKGITHLDLSPSNILVMQGLDNENDKAKPIPKP